MVTGLLAAAVLASASTSAPRSSSATDPCADLYGQFLTACKQALAQCNTLTGSDKSLCISQLAKSMVALRGIGAPRTTTTRTTTTPGGGGGGGGGGGTTTTQAPPPVDGKSADVTPVEGTVLVNGKPLTAGEQIKVGSTVDTTNGTVKLETVSPTGTVQSANFDGGVFKVTQAKHGITDLALVGGDFTTCSTKGTRQVAAAAPASKVVRSLWGNGHGQFETKGRYAAATVRGTWWKTEDRCDGTMIRVKRGVVSVLDLVTHKTIDVPAGHNYLAKP
jgi:hypothetical protein